MTAVDTSMQPRPGPADAIRLRSARRAVSAAFFANGFTVGHWAPKIPVMVERLGVSQPTLGKMIILFGVGALLALIAGAWATTRFGSRGVLRWTSLLLVPSLVMLTMAPTAATAAITMLWLGMFLGAMDNAMNANGVVVETILKKPVMSSYHGFWSLGGVVGGLTGGALISWLGEMGHAVTVSIVTLVVVLAAWPRYLDDPQLANPSGGEAPKAGRFADLPRGPGIYILGSVTLLAFAPEGTVVDWSALYLKDEQGAPVLVSGYAFAAFSSTMALMRFMGDGLRARLGDRMTYVCGAAVAAAGLVIAGLSTHFVVACAGFFVSGLGMANMVPVLFSSGGRYPGVKPAVGIAVITVFGYGGLLFVPALVGELAERFSLAAVFTGWGVILFALSWLGFILPGLSGRSR
ncbi:MFS transporter [Oricola thermophila]|uniref:MFS transporter n=1 Tax=Oricola thermophila TaxID=2742145 RepID=A0A6N1VM76_9HYPH|nr:MFS transporter [Oricola thermophila]QKV20087.1 MFS transporter [Oricola thermophila]